MNGREKMVRIRLAKREREERKAGSGELADKIARFLLTAFTVVDAVRGMSLLVTEEDIVTGVRRCVKNCVLGKAFAANFQQSGHKDAVVIVCKRTTFVVYLNTGTVVRYWNPSDLIAQLKNWDRGQPWASPPGQYLFRTPASVKKEKTEEERKKRAEEDRSPARKEGRKKSKTICVAWERDIIATSK